jgi:hypothetical protein
VTEPEVQFQYQYQALAQDDSRAFAPVPPQTGIPRIDEALGELAAVGDGPPDQLVHPLTEADRALREALDSISED